MTTHTVTIAELIHAARMNIRDAQQRLTYFQHKSHARCCADPDAMQRRCDQITREMMTERQDLAALLALAKR